MKKFTDTESQNDYYLAEKGKRADMDNKEWGRFAEELALRKMLALGYSVRAANWRPKNTHLEVDIICQEGDTIIFVEVKARQGDDYDPAEAVTDSKINRLVRAAEIFMGSEPEGFSYRFDIVTVTGSYENPVLDHIRDAFLPPVC